jgi:hypothetical protein
MIILKLISVLVLLIIVFSKESLVEIKDSTCVLLTMTIKPKYNTSGQSRLEMYKSVVDSYISDSELDIYIVRLRLIHYYGVQKYLFYHQL